MITRCSGILLLSILAASCAQGAAAVPPDASTAASTQPSVPVCGNGVLETGETCECQAGVTGTCAVNDPTQTCASLGEGTGVLLCDAAQCMFDTKSCMSTGAAGTGGSGTGG